MGREHRQLGVVAPSIPDERDWQFPVGVIGDDDLPSAAFVPSPNLPSLQGKQNSCVFNGIPYALEAEAFNEQGIRTDISRAFGYSEARAVRGWRQQDTGCYVRDAIHVCQKIGVVSANLMPYNENDFRTTPTEQGANIGMNLYEEASRNRTAQFYFVPTVAQVKEALARGNMVVFAFSVHRSFNDVADDGLWVPPSGPIDGAHLVTACGYDDDGMGEGALLVANWWKRWGADHPLSGDEGWEHFTSGARRHFWLPYSVWESRTVWDQFTLHAFDLET